MERDLKKLRAAAAEYIAVVTVFDETDGEDDAMAEVAMAAADRFREAVGSDFNRDPEGDIARLLLEILPHG